MGRSAGNMRVLLAVLITVIMGACASIGRIEGGPRDEMPPVFVRSNPAPAGKNVKSNRMDIFFNENIQIKDIASKVVVSPAQEQMPTIIAGGHRLSVQLRDTMIPNTTYTIDFGDAISDLNEGNILDGFAMEFSTGDTIDTLRISGMLLEARTLEPAQGMLVGVHSNLSDTAISTLKLERIARTNQLGQFTIRGLKAGEYRVYALNDVNRDYKWNRGEDVAFYDLVVSPTVNDIIVTDSLRSTAGNDSIVTRPGVEYLPNDIFMTWFNEDYAAQYLKNNNRTDSTKIELLMATQSDSLPTLTIVNGPLEGTVLDNTNTVLETSLKKDSIVYWITDPNIYSRDTLLVATRYLKTDSTDNLSWVTDTLKFNFRRPKVKVEKKKKEEEDTVPPPIPLLEFKFGGGTSQELHRPMTFKAATPVLSINHDLILMEQKIDTNWVKVATPTLSTDPTLNRPCDFTAEYEWEPGGKYRMTIDSMAVTGIYGPYNKKISREFIVKKLDDYSTFTFKLTTDSVATDSVGNEDVKYVVELLNQSDMPIATATVEGNQAYFAFLNEGTYYARAFIDRNGNGKWDTGNVAQLIQPEEVFYYPKKIEIKRNWDVSQSWNLFELPVDEQKPLTIKKNKPKTTSNDNLNNEDDENNEDDDWETDFIPGSQYKDAHKNDRDNSNSFNRNSNNYNRNTLSNRR
ncbi:MAG: Ig-like domain-containing protein [Muribaculaceae bacterium]|nr:Ig-like domain-containing protein [Muribaculaceae bacterium]